MTAEALVTRPPDSREKKLQEKYAESIAGQSDLMDKLAGQLLTLELAVPGLYATALKLVSGNQATVPANAWLYAAFGLWFVALALTLAALFPRQWRVDPTVIKRDPQSKTGALGIEDFFFRSARYKRSLLIPAALFFFAGIAGAALTVL